MKLRDYEIPQYGPGDGLLGQEDLEQYSLKNFDLKAYQLSQQAPDPAPIPAPCESFLRPEADGPSPLAAVREAPSPNPLDPNPWSAPREQPNEPGFGHAPDPVQAAPSQLALQPYDVQFGAHFTLQTFSYTPLSPAQKWKIPRWVVTMVGVFFGSAAVLTLACCVVLLRDPKPAAPEPSAVTTAPVATTAAAPAPSSSPANRAPGEVARAASAPATQTTTKGPLADRAAVRHPSPSTASVMRDDSRHRIVASRHPSAVRRQSYRPRRVASTSESSSVAAQETEAPRRPPQDELDKLLSESSL